MRKVWHTGISKGTRVLRGSCRYLSRSHLLLRPPEGDKKLHCDKVIMLEAAPLLLPFARARHLARPALTAALPPFLLAVSPLLILIQLLVHSVITSMEETVF
jgi:hypothetical protein